MPTALTAMPLLYLAPLPRMSGWLSRRRVLLFMISHCNLTFISSTQTVGNHSGRDSVRCLRLRAGSNNSTLPYQMYHTMPSKGVRVYRGAFGGKYARVILGSFSVFIHIIRNSTEQKSGLPIRYIRCAI